MHSDFSEFSYGYAVTEELATQNKAKIVAAPRFPSLYEEGKTGGYDVKLPMAGKPVFLQFKLSDYLERRNAKEFRNGTMSAPYYRMHLRPSRHSDQHQLLLDLENSGESVFYIAPEFHLPAELNQHYLGKRVVVNSAAFAPSAIGPLPDPDDHYIVFEKWKAFGFFCSDEPKNIAKTSLEGGLPMAIHAKQPQGRELGEAGLRKISDRMLKILEAREPKKLTASNSRDLPGIRSIVSNRSVIEGLGYMCRTFFNTELVVLPSEL